MALNPLLKGLIEQSAAKRQNYDQMFSNAMADWEKCRTEVSRLKAELKIARLELRLAKANRRCDQALGNADYAEFMMGDSDQSEAA